jgi:imidazolonepropionase-like amidohydrolase
MTIALNCARVFDGIRQEIATDQVVLVEENRITAVGARASVDVPPDAQWMDLPHGTLLPGLIDLHAHPTYYFRRPDAAEYGRPAFSDPLITLFAVWQLQQDLAAGITTVRDVGAVNRLTHDIERARQKGFVRVPRLCNSGRIITPTGGHVHDRLGLTHECDGVEGVRLAVREEIRAGAAFIKVAINGADFLSAEVRERASEIQRVANGVEFSQQELDVAVLEAHRAGLKVACHTRWRPAVVKAIQAGVDTVEHATFMTDEDMRAIADKGIVWVPTIYQGVATIKLREKKREAPNGFMNDGVLSEESYVRRRHLFELALRLGVKIGAGTDIFRPEVNFAALVDELEMFVSFGMSNAEAVLAATRTNAHALGWNDRIGAVERGKLADLVYVEGDPLLDLNALRRPGFVMLDGSIVERNV